MSGGHHVVESYDRLAEAYAESFAGELEHKPLDRALLDLFAEHTTGPVHDIGCGPGHIGAYLASRSGRAVRGVDLSPGMVAVARDRYPELSFEVGDVRALRPDSSSAIVSFYALCNIAPEELRLAARSLAAALKPGGWLLVTFHVSHDGEPRVHADEFLDIPIALDFWFYPAELIGAHLAAAGLRVCARLVRPPYEGHEYPSHRAYLLATRVHSANER